MNDNMSMGWLEHRVTPAFREHFGQKMVLVLDNAPHHGGFNPEIRVPELNTELCNTKLLQEYGVKHYCVPLEAEDDRGKKTNIDFRIEIPHEASVSPRSRSENGTSKKEVPRGTRDFSERKHPLRVVERVEAFMGEKGWSVI